MVSDAVTCDRCGATLPASQLNNEARIHHGARELLCIDRRACERRARKVKRKTKDA